VDTPPVVPIVKPPGTNGTSGSDGKIVLPGGPAPGVPDPVFSLPDIINVIG
jgi:hypothetical protein